jgi:DNA-binding IclR family transcriptional regulator
MTIQSVERALDILRVIASKRGPMGLPELSEALQLPKTTIHTIIKTLSNKGFLLQDRASKKYNLGFALYEYGTIQIAELEIQRLAAPILDRLANEIDRQCRLGIWDQNSILITLAVHPVDSNRSSRLFGPRIPAYCTALGKAHLAFMPEEEVDSYLENTELVRYTPATVTDKQTIKSNLQTIRQRGYSYTNGELINYRVAIGAPVFGPDEKVEGALSINLDPHHDNGSMPSADDPIVNRLLQAAYSLSLELGFPAMRTLE